jgi:hypothetical protein
MNNTEGVVRAYHFTGNALRDGRPIPAIGEWLRHEGDIIPCAAARQRYYDVVAQAFAGIGVIL